MVLYSSVFCDPHQTIGCLSLILLISFYTTSEIFSHVCFIIFTLVYMGLISFYQFVNLIGRFGKRILHPNLSFD